MEMRAGAVRMQEEGVIEVEVVPLTDSQRKIQDMAASVRHSILLPMHVVAKVIEFLKGDPRSK